MPNYVKAFPSFLAHIEFSTAQLSELLPGL
jgi:hypothetical protein